MARGRHRPSVGSQYAVAEQGMVGVHITPGTTQAPPKQTLPASQQVALAPSPHASSPEAQTSRHMPSSHRSSAPQQSLPQSEVLAQQVVPPVQVSPEAQQALPHTRDVAHIAASGGSAASGTLPASLGATQRMSTQIRPSLHMLVVRHSTAGVPPQSQPTSAVSASARHEDTTSLARGDPARLERPSFMRRA